MLRTAMLECMAAYDRWTVCKGQVSCNMRFQRVRNPGEGRAGIDEGRASIETATATWK